MSPGEEYETHLLGVFSLDTSETKIGARYSTVVDPVKGLGGGGAGPTLFLLWPDGSKIIFLVSAPPPPPLCQGLDDRPSPPPSPYLKVWIGHCCKRSPFTIFRTKESPVEILFLHMTNGSDPYEMKTSSYLNSSWRKFYLYISSHCVAVFACLFLKAEFTTSKRYLSQAVECLTQCIQIGLKHGFRVCTVMFFFLGKVIFTAGSAKMICSGWSELRCINGQGSNFTSIRESDGVIHFISSPLQLFAWFD